MAADQTDGVRSQFFAGQCDQVRGVGVSQRLGSIDQLAGALGDKNGQGVAIVRLW